MFTWQQHVWFTQDGTHKALRKVAFTDHGVVLHPMPPDFRALEVPRVAKPEPKRAVFQWMTDGVQWEQDYTEGADDITLIGEPRQTPPPE